MSRFRRYWVGGVEQRIQTMRAVWPASRGDGRVTDEPSDRASSLDQQPPQRGVEASACGGESEMMVTAGRQAAMIELTQNTTCPIPPAIHFGHRDPRRCQ